MLRLRVMARNQSPPKSVSSSAKVKRSFWFRRFAFPALWFLGHFLLSGFPFATASSPRNLHFLSCFFRLSMSNESAKSNRNKSLESVPLAEHEILKGKHERLLGEHETLLAKHGRLLGEHETLITKLELLEKKYGFTVEDVEKRQGELVVSRKEMEKWENKFGELELKLEKLEKEIEQMDLLDETGVDSGVIEISDDDEEKERKSNGRHDNSRSSKFSFFL